VARRHLAFAAIGLRSSTACLTVSRAMTSTAYTTHMLIHGTSVAGGASCRPKPELAQRTHDAAGGV